MPYCGLSGNALGRRAIKVLIFDPYPDRPYRISKDTCGGYGTGNDYGDGLVARALKWVVRRSVDWPPMHAMYTAAVLRDQGHTVRYSKTPEPWTDYDLVLVTSSIVACETELNHVQGIVDAGTSAGIIGPFATSQPKPYVDAGAFVVRGEPEFFFLDNPLTPETLTAAKGLVSASGTEGNIDSLPYPAWDLTFGNGAPSFNLLGKGRMLPIVATRGCPYSCFHYCTYPLQQGRKVRLRDDQSIVDEMSFSQDTFGVSKFVFRDPVFSINRKHTFSLCEAIRKSGRQFTFIVETHLNNIDEELAKALVDAGMIMAKVGIESVDENSLKDARRYAIAHEEEKSRLAMLHRLGVETTCMFILGLPQDTEETCRATIEYARELNPLFAQFSVFTPYPGTPAFADFKDRITATMYEEFDQFHLIFRHDGLSARDIRRLMSHAYHRYYARPAWALRYLRNRLAS